MTHEEIEAAIGRLRKILHRARGYNALEVVEAVIPDGPWADSLIDLLKQADPDTHMEVPGDRNGEPIHVRDELCSAYSAVNPKSGGERLTVCGLAYGMDGNDGWRWQDKAGAWHECEWWMHYHKPTVKEVLAEYTEKLLALHNDYDPSDSANDELALLLEYEERFKEATSED